MLRVTRLLPAPTILEGERARTEERQLRRAVEQGAYSEPIGTAVWAENTVRIALEEVFANKCAYCETPVVDTGTGVVEHHRPASNAIDSDGSTSQRHYWWLTNEWTNLLLACVNCSRNKGGRFPVMGTRAEIGQDLSGEEALLLNPCEDHPDAHLTFTSDGLVAGDTPRGRATIDILGLNREALVRQRRNIAAVLFDRVDKLGADSELVREMLDPDQPFAATTSQVLNVSQTAHRRAMENQRKLKALAQQRQSYRLATSSGAMGETTKLRYFGSTKWIERIVLTNFRPMRKLSLDFSRSASGSGPWTVLLGENGTGKSSILQALALTLMGAEQRARLMPDASRNLRRGARVGSVEVYLTGSIEPLVLRFRRGQKDFEAPSAEPALLLGYGSTRLPTRDPNAPSDVESTVVRVDNLFDPLLPITDPTRWLLSLSDELFVWVNRWLAQLLALKQPYRIVRDTAAATVELRAGRSRSSLTDLSDGYQSMLILACDVMRTLLPLWDNKLEQAEGIVLIDELGAHLHPRWRMRVVAALRGVLPRVQFIATTHDPLCLRGLEDGEVMVLRRNDKQDVISISDLPPVKGLRVEQLLASDFFGLGSTRDPHVDDLYDEYYRLRGKPSLSAPERARLVRVEKDLMELDQLGTTEQERLVFRAAGDYIAQRREAGDSDHEEHPPNQDIRQRLLEQWSARLPFLKDGT